MRLANGKMIFPLLAAMVVALMNVSSLYAEEKSWKDETVLVSPQGGQVAVRGVKEPEKILYQNQDAQLAIEWAMGHARVTLVQAGKYRVDDSINAPRDGVRLIIDQGAVIEMNLDADPKTNLGFRSSLGPMAQQLVPIVCI